MEGIPVDLGERTDKIVAKMGDYVSMGEHLVLQGIIVWVELLRTASFCLPELQRICGHSAVTT